MAEFGIRARLRFLWEQSLGGSSPLSPTLLTNSAGQACLRCMALIGIGVRVPFGAQVFSRKLQVHKVIKFLKYF